MSFGWWSPSKIPQGVRQRVVARGPWFQYQDTNGFEWNIVETALPGLPARLAGLRIVQISDLHCRPVWQKAYDELLDVLRADPPDLILVTGDIADDMFNPRPCLPVARRLIGQFAARIGVFGIRGNHDAKLVIGDFDGLPMRMIEGQCLRIQHNQAEFELFGCPGPHRENVTDEFLNSLPTRTPGVPRIGLAHFPDLIRRLRPARPDILFTGHTHGGQVCLPGGIPIRRHDSLPWRYFRGIHRMGETLLVVSRGLGFSTLPIRLFCPAEVIEIRLAEM